MTSSTKHHINERSSERKTPPKVEYSTPSQTPSLILQNHHLDTRIWSDIAIEDSDIFLVSPAKSGSTWMFEVIAQLLYNGNHSALGVQSLIELCLSPTFTSFRALGATPEGKALALENIEKQRKNGKIKHRVFKLHEPIESIPFYENCKYVVVMRDFRDIVWSFYRHYLNYNDSIIEAMNQERDYEFRKFVSFGELEEEVKREEGVLDEKEYWEKTLTCGDDFGNGDGFPFWSQLWVIGSWLNAIDSGGHTNIHLVHYNDMKQDLAQVMSNLARFLDIPIQKDTFQSLVGSCGFEEMKRRSKEVFGEAGNHFWKEPSQFFYKGVNGRWRETLTEDDIAKYRTVASRYLTHKQIQWLEQSDF